MKLLFTQCGVRYCLFKRCCAELGTRKTTCLLVQRMVGRNDNHFWLKNQVGLRLDISQLMTSDYAWSCISLVSHIASEADRFGIWAECCPCPEHATVGHATPKQPHRKRRNCEPPGAASCHFKCCRAPELATGQAMAMQSGYLDKCLWEFSESLGETPPQRRVELQGAFSKALGRLWGFLFQSTGKYAFAFLPPFRGLNVT